MGGVAILAVYINYANYICAIVVLLAYSHKYRARINNRLYGILLCPQAPLHVHEIIVSDDD